MCLQVLLCMCWTGQDQAGEQGEGLVQALPRCKAQAGQHVADHTPLYHHLLAAAASGALRRHLCCSYVCCSGTSQVFAVQSLHTGTTSLSSPVCICVPVGLHGLPRYELTHCSVSKRV